MIRFTANISHSLLHLVKLAHPEVDNIISVLFGVPIHSHQSLLSTVLSFVVVIFFGLFYRVTQRLRVDTSFKSKDSLLVK